MMYHAVRPRAVRPAGPEIRCVRPSDAASDAIVPKTEGFSYDQVTSYYFWKIIFGFRSPGMTDRQGKAITVRNSAASKAGLWGK